MAPGTDNDPSKIVPEYRTEELFGAHTRIFIVHGGFRYCLMITRQGKLILNK